MDANICAASRALMDWDMAYDERISSSSLQHYSHLQPEESQPSHVLQRHSPSSSPSFSSESESYPLSRCSSISSLSSAYSDSDTSDTEDCSDNAHFLISILKKPRLQRGSKHQQQQQGCESSRQISHHQHNFNNDNSSHSGNNNGNNSYADNAANGGLKEYVTENEEDDDDDEWQDLDDDDDDDDDESECEIIFERNVTFDDPLATDIITGAPITPSSRSRVEWTMLKARERLERRLGFLGAFDEEEEGGDDNMSQYILEEERHEDLDGESKSKRGTETRGTTDDDDGNIEAYVLDITEAAIQYVELERIQ